MLRGRVVFVYIEPIGEVYYLISTQSDIGVPAKPVEYTDTADNLYSRPIALRHILGEIGSRVGVFTRQYKLIFVIHKIQIGTDTKTVSYQIVTEFVIEESFGERDVVGTRFGEVASRRFSIGNGKRGVQSIRRGRLRRRTAYSNEAGGVIELKSGPSASFRVETL